MTTKMLLRAKQKELLANLVPQRAAAAAAVTVPSVLDRLRPYPVVALYSAFPDEFDPLPLGMALLEYGHAIALPRVAQKGAPLVFCAWHPRDPMSPDVLGIQAPRADAPPLAPDLILAPLLAFDHAGNRLGRGAGYYDRTMNALIARGTRPAYAGLAFQEQLTKDIPLSPHDVPLDFVITPAGIMP